MKRFRKPVLILLSLCLFSCEMEGNRANNEKFREEKKNREIKRVKDGEILNEALATGRAVSQAAQQQLFATLQQAISSHGVPGAVAYCHVEALPLMDSLSQASKAQVRRVSLQYRNPEDKPSDLEAELLDAYAYSIEQGEDPGDNTQMLDDGRILYTRPILLGTDLCLNCHGTQDQISEETQAKLDELYPGDKATGYQKGELRGMWSIELDKAEIIKNM